MSSKLMLLLLGLVSRSGCHRPYFEADEGPAPPAAGPVVVMLGAALCIGRSMSSRPSSHEVQFTQRIDFNHVFVLVSQVGKGGQGRERVRGPISEGDDRDEEDKEERPTLMLMNLQQYGQGTVFLMMGSLDIHW
nr:hypothetical protein B21J21.100 [imported] - Neurospora crassa [Neurospora crassa]